MKKQFFGDFALCGWVTDFRRFEETYRLILQVYESLIWLITLITQNMKALGLFETAVIRYPPTRHNRTAVSSTTIRFKQSQYLLQKSEAFKTAATMAYPLPKWLIFSCLWNSIHDFVNDDLLCVLQTKKKHRKYENAENIFSENAMGRKQNFVMALCIKTSGSFGWRWWVYRTAAHVVQKKTRRKLAKSSTKSDEIQVCRRLTG